MPHPKIEVEVGEDLVRSLLRTQHPDLADLPLTWAGTGWDNALWRLGEDLVLRFPVRALSAPLVAHEQEWLPVLAPRLPVPVPVPVRVGLPSPDFPWAWSVLRWIDGVPVDRTPVAGRAAWAEQLADVLVALHQPAPPEAPENPFRGVPLETRAPHLQDRLEALALPDAAQLLALFDELAAAPAWDGPPLWLHGDPHPANLLARDGRLAGLLDFGDVTSGDPASDLSTAWLTFDTPGRARFRARVDAACGYDDATWRRARGWALSLGVVLLMHPVEYPHLAEVGGHALAQVRSGDD